MMLSLYVLHFYFGWRAPFLERFACIPSSPRLLGLGLFFLITFVRGAASQLLWLEVFTV